MFQAQIPLDKKELFMRKSVLISKRAIVLTGLVLALSAAVYLNWQYSGGKDSLSTASRDETKIGQSVYVNNTVSNTPEEDYFSKTATEREKSRNNTVAEFDGIINNAKASDEAKKQAETNKNTIINNIEKEINIETLVKAKGFENAVAVILPVTVFSAVLYTVKGYVTIKQALPFIPTGILGAFLGAWFIKKISPEFLKKIFGGFMIYAGIRLLLR